MKLSAKRKLQKPTKRILKDCSIQDNGFFLTKKYIEMKKIRIGLVIIALILIIAELIILYHKNWTWGKNVAGAYIMLFANICAISSSILSGIYTMNKNKIAGKNSFSIQDKKERT
jgi:hypothetical protein